MVLHGGIQTWTRTTPELLGPQRGDIDEKKSVRDNGRRLGRLSGLGFLWMR